MIYLYYFFEITGISKGTFYNTLITIYKDGLIYNIKQTVDIDLILHKIKKKCQKLFIDFEQIRSKFSHEL